MGNLKLQTNKSYAIFALSRVSGSALRTGAESGDRHYCIAGNEGSGPNFST
ncbi:hypothetical protein RHMOL_Rhmol09G0148000 [Rhododendron molle]|uniref:Uncharacterized protein n=1 Tax=Rhododendron molle TaxID=49168 RepID=A0ACC0MEJ1_RHOML|nr:hypothetical protein RHMOL_Rhmol09G0148000 [Rhododendron molle]